MSKEVENLKVSKKQKGNDVNHVLATVLTDEQRLDKRLECIDKWKNLLFDDEITITQALLGVSYESEAGFK